VRSLTLDGIQSLFAQTTDHVWLLAATITPAPGKPGLTWRFVSNNEDIVYSGNTYTKLGLEVNWAADDEDSVPQAQLKLSNVGREAIPLIRQAELSDHPQAFLELFRVHGSSVVRELGPTKWDVLGADVDVGFVTLTLGINVDFLNEPAQIHTLSPNLAPGLFA